MSMQVVSEGPFTAASVIWRPAPDRCALTLVCKATYRLRPGVSPLADSPEPPYGEDHYSRESPGCSLYAASDLVPGRPQADVLLVGRACAPSRTPLRRIVTRFAVGSLDKRVEVFAHRYYEPSGELCWGPPLSRMSLWYERAAGGAGTDNPVGMRISRRRADGRIYLPNLQPPGMGNPEPSANIPAICYGPIAPSWPTRRRLAADAAPGWDGSSWWQGPLPPGLAPAFFNTAPADQQLSRLADDQPILLENLLPDQPILRTRLCGVRPRATAKRLTGASESIELVADTLWLDTVRQIATLVWRGRVALSDPSERGTIEITLDPKSRAARPTPPRPPRRRSRSVPPPLPARAVAKDFRPDDTSPTLTRPQLAHPPASTDAAPQPPSGPASAAPALRDDDSEPTQTDLRPARAGPPSPPPPSAAELPDPQAFPGTSSFGFEPTQVLPAEWAQPSDPGWTMPLSPDEVSYEGIPDVSSPTGWSWQQMLAEADEGETVPDGAAAEAAASETATLDGPISSPPDALPFRPAPDPEDTARLPSQSAAAEPKPPPVSDGPIREPSWVRPTAVQSLAKVQQLRERRLDPSPWAGERSAGAGRQTAGSWPPSDRDEAGEPPSSPPEPPLLGPLATYDMVRRADGVDDAPVERAVSEAAIAAGIAAGSIDEPAELPPVASEPADSVADPSSRSASDAPSSDPDAAPSDADAELPSVAQCAAIAASIDRRPDARDAILEQLELDRDRWCVLEAHYADAISTETAKGRSQLLRAYDAAYVEQLEAERGPIEPAEYAQIAVAAESGDSGEVLESLELPRGALLRIERVMASRVAESAATAEQVRKAIQAERQK